MRYVVSTILIAFALTACTRQNADSSPPAGAVAPAVATAAKEVGYQAYLVTRVREAAESSQFREKLRERDDAVQLCDSWLPIPHPAGWCNTEKNPEVKALLLDAVRLQEGDFAVAAEALAVNALVKAGDSASVPAKALTGAFIDMYAPAQTPDTDGADAAFDADLQRYWDQWQQVQKDVAGTTPENKPILLLRLKGELYRDPLAVSAGSLLGPNKPTPEDLKAQESALARIAAFHASEGG